MRGRIRSEWEEYEYAPIGPLPIASEVWVTDVDEAERYPFGFQLPSRRRTSTRPLSRQARANQAHREIA